MPQRVEGWVDLDGWFHPHPSSNRAQCRLTTLIEANALTTTLLSTVNVHGGYGLLAAYIGGPAAQAQLKPFLYSSREPSELSQWLCHDDSTINIIVVIIIIIIM